jgi:FkbM family methyltransferase
MIKYTQKLEDKLIYDKYFKNYTLEGDKYYAEVGAGDGFTFSNTKYYEDELKWRGILIEPNVYDFSRLLQRRGNNTLVNVVISDQKEPLEFNICIGTPSLSCVESTKPNFVLPFYHTVNKFKTLSVLLDTILKKSTLPRIDFCVVDVCGHELNVLKSFTFTYPVVLWSIDLSYNKDEIISHMESNNCKFMEEINTSGIFINKNYLQNFNL